MIADPSNNRTFWSGGSRLSGSVYVMSVSRTTNSGSTWSRYNLTSGAGCTYALAVDPTNSNVVYAGGKKDTFPALFKTTNAGLNWSDLSAGLRGCVNDIAIDHKTTSTVFAATDSGVYKSTNGGSNWTYKECPHANALIVHSSFPDTVYAGTSNGVFMSTVGGNEWTQINEGLDTLAILSLDINAPYLFAGTDGRGMYRRGIEIGVEEETERAKNNWLFAQPNPTRAGAMIHYALPHRTHATLAMYGVDGSIVRQLVSRIHESGTYILFWDGCDESGETVPSGIYFCRLSAVDAICTTKLLLVH